MAIDFPIQLRRQYTGPLDVDTVFDTTAEMESFLSTEERRYAGMIVACLEQEGKAFILNSARDQWLSVALGFGKFDELDDEQVTIDDEDLLVMRTYNSGSASYDNIKKVKASTLAYYSSQESRETFNDIEEVLETFLAED